MTDNNLARLLDGVTRYAYVYNNENCEWELTTLRDDGQYVRYDDILAALEAAPVPDLGEAAAMVLDAMNDGEVWGRAVNAAMPIINADLDQSAWVTVSEVREALVAALRALIDEARDD